MYTGTVPVHSSVPRTRLSPSHVLQVIPTPKFVGTLWHTAVFVAIRVNSFIPQMFLLMHENTCVTCQCAIIRIPVKFILTWFTEGSLYPLLYCNCLSRDMWHFYQMWFLNAWLLVVHNNCLFKFRHCRITKSLMLISSERDIHIIYMYIGCHCNGLVNESMSIYVVVIVWEWVYSCDN